MSEYVAIKTSTAEILSAATDMITQGVQMDTDMVGLVGQITSSEGTDAWGTDDFGKSFTKNYLAPPKGGSGPAANASVKDVGSGKNSLGAAAQHLGTGVSSAMTNYAATDTSSAQGIDGLV